MPTLKPQRKKTNKPTNNTYQQMEAGIGALGNLIMSREFKGRFARVESSMFIIASTQKTNGLILALQHHHPTPLPPLPPLAPLPPLPPLPPLSPSQPPTSELGYLDHLLEASNFQHERPQRRRLSRQDTSSSMLAVSACLGHSSMGPPKWADSLT